ncbi:phosphatidylinositol 3 and 4-kinase-domain-containing protein [Mycena floridula]|nr:phosphatidylinositol 3 and 4-kinase-domain-containing protein [Mycena floridula]
MSARSTEGYQPLLSRPSVEEEDVGDIQAPQTRSPGTRGRRARPGSIDLTKLDTAFKRWTESIAKKVRGKKKVTDVPTGPKTIWRSVFEPTVMAVTAPETIVKTLDHKHPMTKAEFDEVSESIRACIREGIHPKLITKGSSGSYFARAKLEGRVTTVAVFKPKDEEPYGRLNPKTTKWIHRKFSWIIPFGRACLIPNLSYISEAAASLLDERLALNIVPRTELVSFSSPAFFYDWLDRNAAKKGKQLPEKIGSLQYFLHGYTDASEFLRKHPWPGRAIADTFDDSTHRQGGVSKRFMSAFKVICGKTGDTDDMYDDYEDEHEHVLYDESESHDPSAPFYWTQSLQQSFREELEKLVILDYLMLNTDRGADNYMIKYCEADHEKSLVDVAPSRSERLEMPLMSELRKSEGPRMNAPASRPSTPAMDGSSSRTSTPHGDYRRRPHIHIAAIDNSLSFPHEHPQGWRSFTFGWLYLPVSIIGRPFSEKTRNHFLPLLTSKTWWEETTFQLQKLFAVDADFHPKMFSRQLAVMKGQAWNIVQSLRHSDEGPLELTRRVRLLVWDDELEIAEEPPEELVTDGPMPPSPKPSNKSVPLPKRTRSSSGSDFPPPIRRVSTDLSGAPRPIPFAAKFQRVHPGTTGVTVLEHLERLDAVEASLQRLNIQDDEEVDVGDSRPSIDIPRDGNISAQPVTSPFSPPGSPLATVPEVPSSSNSSVMEEEDLVSMSKSTSHVEGNTMGHIRWASQNQVPRNMEWLQQPDTPLKRTVIVERLETVKGKPFCSCW